MPTQPKLPWWREPNLSENALKILKDEVHRLYNNKATRGFHELHTSTFNMVTLKDADKLYFGIMATLAFEIRQISVSIESAEDGNFLEELNRKWICHKKALEMVGYIMIYMDINFIKKTKGAKTIDEIGFRDWIDFVIGSRGIREKLPATLVELVLRERNGEVINRGLMVNIIKMLMDLGMPVYEKNFKKPFLATFEDIYGSESLELIKAGDCGDYLKEAERRINEEWLRVSDYLDPSCESNIISVVVKQMIGNHMETLVHMKNSGLVDMLRNDNYADLERMYNLFSRVPSGLTVVKDVMMSSIQYTGKQLIMDPKRLEDPEAFAQRLLVLKDKYEKVVKRAFNSDEIFQNVLHSAFGNFINLNAESDFDLENSGLVHMFKGDKYVDLEILYNLFRSVPYGLVIVKDVMMSSIQYTGKQLIMDPKRLEDPEAFAQRLLVLKDKYEKVVKRAFNSDEIFQNVLHSTFGYFINLNAESDFDLENSRLVHMFKGDKYVDLEILYNLFRSVPYGLVIVKDAMISSIRATGKQLIMDPERLKDPEAFAQHLLDLKDKYEKVVTLAFHSDEIFHNVLNSAFERVMTSFIRHTGKKLIMDPERLKYPLDLVQRLLDLKDKYDKAITLAFNNDKKFQNALNSAFEYFINLNARSPEFISLFVDDKLRRGLKGVGEEDVEIVLDKVMMLFRYLREKDMFEKYHKQHLAKRLLSGKTISDEAERSLIVKIKTECGYQLTSKLEGMLADMKTSSDMMKGFLQDHGTELGDSPTLSVKVLRTGSWPIQSSPQCNLPSEVLGPYEKFHNYYLGKQVGRRLSLKTSMGTADLMATFGKGQKYELNVSTYQMCVLMLFNNADRLSCKEIEQSTEIPMPDLKRCLQSLALVKGKNVLRKEPMSKDIAEDDAFVFNDKFTSKLFKVRIGTVAAQRESEQESVETRKRVEEDRKPQIEAAIVRVMKYRKILKHNNIIAEVTQQLLAQFLPNPAAIKKGIESLIERDYLKRDEADRNTYHYLA